MNKSLFFILISGILIILSLGSILLFSDFANAKWFDDGIDIITGIILIYLATLLFYAYKKSGMKNILSVSIGVFFIAFQRVLQVFLQEWQISINYNYPLFFGFNSGILLWGIADLIVAIGTIFMFWGFKEIIK